MNPAEAGHASTLAELAEAYWDAYLLADPTQGTAVGDHRYDDRLPDLSEAGRHFLAARFQGLHERVAALPPDAGDAEARLTRAALLSAIETQLALLAADAVTFTVDPMSGPQSAFMNVATFQPLRSPAEGAAMLSRWRAMGPWLDELVVSLRRGMASGRAPVAGSVERVLDQLDELLALPLAEWTLLAPLTERPDAFPDEAWLAFGADLTQAVREEVRPAFARYRAFLADEALPVGRDEAHVGLCHLPGGSDRYARLVRAHTTTDRTTDELHAIGQAEVARIDAEMAELGARVLGRLSLGETLTALRADPSVHFKTGEEIVEVAERSLARAKAAIPSWFGRLPMAPCVVTRMLAHEERHSTIAYYREPTEDGSRPGRYYINTYAPTTRPRYEAEALAFHEAVPGHHLQVAIAQELADLPIFRRNGMTTAYVEGWGLYSERLADEMKLFSADLDRLGMLSSQALRAVRLVVDSGIHTLGWTRQQAIDYMLAHTAEDPADVVSEVDRYIIYPGQATAYMLGKLEISKARAEAQQAMGSKFDIRQFHDRVLEDGAIPVSFLHEKIRRGQAR